ncbi:MAG: fatty acid desaturase [Betaproteobacteria bacterium]|nr:fatty acid desaturase [Betaproteobacteria bacterium]
MRARTRYPTIYRRLADPDVLRKLSVRDTPRWLRAIAFEWLLIASVIAVCASSAEWAVWIAGGIAIGTRQHALSILGHEGAHRLISHSRAVNDLLGNWVALYPLLITVQGYRSSHISHHWYLETRDDPSKVSVDHHPRDWTFPMSGLHLAGMLARDLSGLSQASSTALLKYVWQIRDPAIHVGCIAVVQVVLATLITLATGSYWAYPVLWLFPLFTVVVACYRVRAVAEHSAFGDATGRYRRAAVDPLKYTRTTLVRPWLACVFAPYNVSYHIEHHVYPSVSCFNLKKLHDHIAEHPDYQRYAHITHGYKGLIAEIQGISAAKP